jgi:lipoate-protein ligase A
MYINCIIKETDEIFFNLATEEFLLKEKQDNFFLIWQSEPCVVVGKHQNAMAEINHAFLKERRIPVARRLTGGGTVYHDPGNVNFTFIMNGEKGRLVDFRKYFMPVIGFLRSKNVPAESGAKNDIVVNGRKISGNAEHVYKNRVLHHGTLLFDSDLNILQRAIYTVPGKYIDKAVQSNQATVENISTFLDPRISVNEFIKEFYSFMKNYLENTREYTFTKEETVKIMKLRDGKYVSWDWIFGYSPVFEIKREIDIADHKSGLYVKVDHGTIKEIFLNHETLKEVADNLSAKLTGIRYDYEVVHSIMKNLDWPVPGLKEILLKSLF